MRKFLSLLVMFVLIISLVSCNDELQQEDLVFNEGLDKIYLLAFDAGLVNGTYEQWLLSMSKDNKEIALRVEDNKLQWIEKGSKKWNNLYFVVDLVGSNKSGGPSFYELYQLNNPSYTGDYEIWLKDLIKGNANLIEKSEVTFIYNDNKTSDKVIEVNNLSKIPKQEEPTRVGYTFGGWYIEDEQWSFSGHVVTENMTLEARWNKVFLIELTNLVVTGDSLKFNIAYDISQENYATLDYDSIEVELFEETTNKLIASLKYKDEAFFNNLNTETNYKIKVSYNYIYNETFQKESYYLEETIETLDELIFDVSNKVTLKVGHSLGSAQVELIEKYATSFYKTYPNVKIEFQYAPSPTYLKDQVIDGFAKDNYPNLVIGRTEHIYEYLNSNKVVNLDRYIYENKYGLNGLDDIEDIVNSYLDEGRQYISEGNYYSLPFSKTSEILMYNKTAFDALGLTKANLATWQDIMAIAPQLKQYGQQGLSEAEAKMVVPVVYESNENAFSTIIKQWNGSNTDINYKTNKGEFLWQNNDNNIAALQYFSNKARAGLFASPTYWDYQYVSDTFMKEQTFIIVSNSISARHNIPSDNRFIVDTAPMPYNRDMPENKGAFQQGNNLSILSHDDKQTDLAAWLFLKHIINTNNTLDYAINTGYSPVRQSALNSNLYQSYINLPITDQVANSLAGKAVYNQTYNMFYEQAYYESYNVRKVIGDAFGDIISNKSTINDALNDAYNKVIKWQ